MSLNKYDHLLQQLPPVIFGTSFLGNIYEVLPYETKLAIVSECVKNSIGTPIFDSAGKYGAGLALTMLGKCLKDLNVTPKDVIISNKLGWYQTELTTPEPTFERDIWKELDHDAIQKISYKGILECFHQGNELLGDYTSQMASVHDPDEYLAKATNPFEEEKLFNDILEAYQALNELKAKGLVSSIGVGSKQWKVIQRITNLVDLDWIMIANSLTLHSHPIELIEYIKELDSKNVAIINSAVFNGGFLVGSDYYNYHKVDKESIEGAKLYEWRQSFYDVCKQFSILPSEACFNFGFNIPGITSVALSTSNPIKVKPNIEMATKKIPTDFWQAMLQKGLIDPSVLNHSKD